MIIPFEIDKKSSNEQELYYGDKKRFSTMTSVILITPNLLVGSSYYSREIYLVSFDIEDETYKVLDTISTCGDAKMEVPGPTDLIDYRLCDNGTKQLILSNFNQCSMSIYEIIDNDKKIKQVRTIINTEYGNCHGISYYPGDKDIIFVGTSGTRNPNCGAYAINLMDDSPKPFFGIKEKGWLCKDVCFMNSNNVFVLYCDSAPNPHIRRRYSAKIALYYIDMNPDVLEYGKISEHKIEQHHADAIKYHNGKLYVTVEGVDTPGRVYILDIDNKSGDMSFAGDIKGYCFPHGIDIKYGMIAISEYGKSDIVINKFKD